MKLRVSGLKNSELENKNEGTSSKLLANQVSLKKLDRGFSVKEKSTLEQRQISPCSWSTISSANFNDLLAVMSPEDQEVSMRQKNQASSYKTPWGAVAWENSQGESYVGPAYEYSKIASMIASDEYTPELAPDKDSIKTLFAKTRFHLFVGSSQWSLNLGTVTEISNHGLGFYEFLNLFQGHQSDAWCRQTSREVVSLIQKTGIYPIDEKIPSNFFEDQLVPEIFSTKQDADTFKESVRYELFKVLAGDDSNVLFKHMLLVENLDPFAIRYEEDNPAIRSAERKRAVANLALIREHKISETGAVANYN